jgi:hypothetical protein
MSLDRDDYGVVVINSGGFGSAAMMAPVAGTGLGWVRLTVYWDDTEPIKNNYSWHMKEDIENAKANGMKVYLTIQQTPSWAGPTPQSPPNDYNDWMDFLAAARLAFEDSSGNSLVDIWGIWNEPNGGDWSGTMQQYADLVITARTALGPNVKIAAPDIAHCDNEGCTHGTEVNYLSSLYLLIASHIDYVSIHIYKILEADFVAYFNQLHAAVSNFPNVLITEGGREDNDSQTEAQQRDHLDMAFCKLDDLQQPGQDFKFLGYWRWYSPPMEPQNQEIRGKQAEETVKELLGVKAPTPPILQVTPDICQTYLFWEDRSGEDHFEIWRSTGSEGRFQKIATVPRNVNTYNDTSAECWTSYEYQVRAVNSAGQGISNTVQVTTF